MAEGFGYRKICGDFNDYTKVLASSHVQINWRVHSPKKCNKRKMATNKTIKTYVNGKWIEIVCRICPKMDNQSTSIFSKEGKEKIACLDCKMEQDGDKGKNISKSF